MSTKHKIRHFYQNNAFFCKKIGGFFMAKKVDRRVRKTKMQLRQGLARLMQKKSIKEITVKELVDEVDINRSTFYLHYTDIYQMLEKIEEDMRRILPAHHKQILPHSPEQYDSSLHLPMDAGQAPHV